MNVLCYCVVRLIGAFSVHPLLTVTDYIYNNVIVDYRDQLGLDATQHTARLPTLCHRRGIEQDEPDSLSRVGWTYMFAQSTLVTMEACWAYPHKAQQLYHPGLDSSNVHAT